MKTNRILIALFIAALLLSSCTLRLNGRDVELIDPSDTIITEERQVSAFDAIEFSTFGKVILSQGDSESLTIQGSDNIVPLVNTEVRNGVLIIYMEEDINITSVNKENVLTFTITVRELNSLTISGAGEVSMERLDTSEMKVELSGAGQFALDELSAERLDVIVSGVGSVEIAGEVKTARIEISGAGPVICPDLKIETATVNISGIGGAEVWVTDQLSGEISGGGNVSYYGNPQTNTTTSGIGVYQSKGDK